MEVNAAWLCFKHPHVQTRTKRRKYVKSLIRGSFGKKETKKAKRQRSDARQRKIEKD